MGRIRTTLRSVFSFGGWDGVSPIAKEDEKTILLKQQTQLAGRQARKAGRPAAKVAGKRYCSYCHNETMTSPDGSTPYVHVANSSFSCP